MDKIIMNLKVAGVLLGIIFFYIVSFFFEPQIIVIKEHLRRRKERDKVETKQISD